MLVEMYGHCDDFDVVYTCIEPGLWQATVPADLTDGKYVVDIYGVDSTGYIVYWTGILYMYDGRVISLELLPDSAVTVWTDSISVSCVWDSTDIIDIHTSAALSKGCGCY